MSPIQDAELLRLYDVETRQLHSQLDHILKVRGMSSIAFAAVLSATLYYQKAFLGLGGLVFLMAWYWEYVYARYMGVYGRRAERLGEWIAENTAHVKRVSEAYASSYDHRLTNRFLSGFGLKDKTRLHLATFFDLPRMVIYLAISLAPIVIAIVLRFPWT